jgi:hypothetical protein
VRKTRSRTWQIRAQRYFPIIPEKVKKLEMMKPGGETQLRKWVSANIPREGEKIFRGVLKPRPQVTLFKHFVEVAISDTMFPTEDDLSCAVF